MAYIKNMDHEKVTALAGLVSAQPGQVVSRTPLQKGRRSAPTALQATLW